MGSGISKKHIRRIFRRFYRVPDEAVNARHGTGLGLYVVSMLVRLLGARLDVHSGGVGHGTTMSLRIPLHRGKKKRKARSNKPSPEGAHR